MKTTRLDPFRLSRNAATHEVEPTAARVMQHADLLYQAGRVRRAKGLAMAEVEGSSTTVTGAGVFERRDCKKVLIDGNTGGTVRITPGRVAACSGPLPQWVDQPDLIDGNPTLDDDYDVGDTSQNGYRRRDDPYTTFFDGAYNASGYFGVGKLSEGGGSGFRMERYRELFSFTNMSGYAYGPGTIAVAYNRSLLTYSNLEAYTLELWRVDDTADFSNFSRFLGSIESSAVVLDGANSIAIDWAQLPQTQETFYIMATTAHERQGTGLGYAATQHSFFAFNTTGPTLAIVR